jgi:iron complex outermembrane receptor protein
MTKKVLPPHARAWLLAAAASLPTPALLAQETRLPDVRVTAPRFADTERTLPYGVSVITADEIRASGASNVNEAIMRMLGVPGRADFYGGGEYSLDLRGFGVTADNNQVIVVDGVRISEADLGGTRLVGIPIESVERIEVLRGSGAVLYGEGATGGVIVITTRAGTGRQVPDSASLHGAFGSYQTTEARASAHVGSGGFGLDASAQKRKTDGYRDNSASDVEAFTTTAQWAGDWLRLGVRLSQDDLDSRLPGALSSAQYASNPRQASRPDDWATLRGQRGAAFAVAELGGWQVAFDAAHREKELRSLNAGFAYDYDIDANTYALRARHEGNVAGLKNAFVLGADFDDWRRNVLGAFAAQANQRSRGYYLKDDVTLADGTRFSLGARTSHISKDNSSSGTGFDDQPTAWELGISHPFGDAITAYARVGTSFRLANVDEFNFTSPGLVLQPQTSRDMEAGVRYAWTGGKLDARLYSSRLENEIGFDPNAPGPFGFAGANINFDPTHRQGVELDATHALMRALSLRLNAAWREATFRSGPYSGNSVPLVPRGTVALRADWTPLAGHRLSGGLNWVSSQHPDFANACSMPAYVTTDARYAFQVQSLELALGVTNLFDRKYYTQAFACAAGQVTSIYPEAGRAFTASARVQF